MEQVSGKDRKMWTRMEKTCGRIVIVKLEKNGKDLTKVSLRIV